MVTDSVKILQRAKDFLKLNSYLIWICFAALTIANIIYIGGIRDDTRQSNAETKQIYKEMKDLIEKEIQGVVILTQNGAVLNASKSYIDASNQTDYNKAIKNVLISHLVFSNNELTANFSRKFNNTSDILAYEPLQEFQDNFLASDKTMFDRWNYIISNIAGLSKNLQIPDSVAVIDSTIRDYSWDTKNQSFKISINVVTKSYFWNDISKSFDETQGYYTIDGSGTISVKDNTTLNPLGIKFYNLNLNIPTRN